MMRCSPPGMTRLAARRPAVITRHAYDATNILLEAVAAAAVEADDGTLLIGRGAIRDALAATEDYPGLTGNLTCLDESPFAGDCATGTALAMFVITEAEVYDDNWPPPMAWNFAAESDQIKLRRLLGADSLAPQGYVSPLIDRGAAYVQMEY